MSRYPQGDLVEEARLLLPWYITGKLSEPERKLVEQQLAQHPELQAEYRRELVMVDMIRANTGLLQLTAMDTTQQRLGKLMKRIGREEQAKADQDAAVKKPAGNNIPSFSFGQWWRDLLPKFEWLSPANAAFAVLLLVQAGFLGWFAYTTTAPREGVYISADVVDNKASIPLANGTVLLVDFNADATIHQVRDFLLHWNAHILDGPDDNNLFKIEVKGAPLSDQQSNVILQQMGQDRAVISFIGREF